MTEQESERKTQRRLDAYIQYTNEVQAAYAQYMKVRREAEKALEQMYRNIERDEHEQV